MEIESSTPVLMRTKNVLQAAFFRYYGAKVTATVIPKENTDKGNRDLVEYSMLLPSQEEGDNIYFQYQTQVSGFKFETYHEHFNEIRKLRKSTLQAYNIKLKKEQKGEK